MRKAVKGWVEQLIDLGGRNNLLHFRDLKRGTLDLGRTDDPTLAAFLGGRTVKLSKLFRDDPLAEAVRRARAIHAKSKENFEERGLDTLYLGCGLATWTNARGAWVPAAPVLLMPAALEPLGASRDDFELSLSGDAEVNPTLLHLLKLEFQAEIDPETLLDFVDGPIDENWEVDAALNWLTEQADRVPGFSVSSRFVLANFSYAKLPMVRDLQNSEVQLIAHDLIAALAGDQGAREEVRSLGPGANAIPSLEPPPADEFLVLDADSTQTHAINAALGGQHLIVRGPPGTGKSQSIANLIGAMVARGRRVLFVAEKRAAIEAVLKRLRQHNLDGLVLDLHGRLVSRKTFAQQIAKALYSSREAQRVDPSAQQRELVRRRNELNRYAEALHSVRVPWNVSVYEIQARLIGIPEGQVGETSVDSRNLRALDADAIERASRDLDSYVGLGGARLATGNSPWRMASVATSVDAAEAFELVESLLRRSLPTLLSLVDQATIETGIPVPRTIAEVSHATGLWGSAEQALAVFEPAIFDGDLADNLHSMARGGDNTIGQFIARLTSAEYRGARAKLRTLLKESAPTDGLLRTAATRCQTLQAAWLETGATTRPGATRHLEALTTELAELVEGVARLAAVTERPLDDLSLEDIRRELQALTGDRATLAKLPEMRRLGAALDSAGLRTFLAELSRAPDADHLAVTTLERMWLQAILDQVLLTDKEIGAVTGDALDRSVEEFKSQDRAHLETTADRIRRLCAEIAVGAQDQFPDQAHLVRNQATRKRGHMPVRDLVAASADVLLALKPCWAMSPLMVSQLLPSRPYFDVVVFDEASQVTPADAATSVVRGRQLVVAGDEHQLPPTAFFVAESAGDLDDDPEDEDDAVNAAIAGGGGFESILDILKTLVPFRMLQWHYRSRDERLIAFSNVFIYDGMLTTFPAVSSDPCVLHHSVPLKPGAATNSPSPEVEAVVGLVIEHAQTRPLESLGVIAMGIKHANRIDEALRLRIAQHPELEEFFNEDREEAFFVKNLERVQGDERDAVILTIGYGKNERGQLLYTFGPLLKDGGERRLNVAVTRAKHRMTLVSSFTSADLDPERLNSEGMRLLRQYVLYAESGGARLAPEATQMPTLNPFEADVRDTLTARGMRLDPQHGASGYRIDFAVLHPRRPGQFVLALECDGASFHSAQDARDRDRLRQEQLERLGWRFHRIWSSQWFHDKEGAVAKVMAAYETAVADADGATSSRAAAPSGGAGRDRPVPASPGTGVPPEESKAIGASQPRGAVRGPRPAIPPGWTIVDYERYRSGELVELIRWIESDGLLRTEDELVSEASRELGFSRKGVRIVGTLEWAIKRARRKG